VVEYEYDIMDRVTNISWRTTSGATLGGFAYEYDAVGRIVSRDHVIGTNAFSRSYDYDSLDRLASDDGVTYTYDAAGNRMTRTENGATVTYTLGVGDRLASWNGGAYTHDIAGNVTRIERTGRPTLDLTWNSQYQLVSVSTNGVFAESYAYDALGRRVSTTTLEGTTRHVYDDNWQVVADLDEQDNVIASYTWGDGIDNLLAVSVGGATYHPLTDIQGTVWGYVDSKNNVVARWQYDAWGNVVDEEIAPNVAALASIRYRFQGREWSAATGLVNFRMRWYDPETGRWLSKDPIGLNGGLNLYVFCDADALNYVDWNGFGKFKIFTWTVKGLKKYVSRNSAKKILSSKTKKVGTVTLEGKGVNKAAKRLCEEVTDCPIVRHDPHQVGWHTHYQPKSGGFHVNVPGANIGVMAFGDGFWGNAVDFFNPLSDIQDVFDLVEEFMED
jgi:RHS repeat-associated protein